MKKRGMLLIYVDYEEYKPETYKGVGLRENLSPNDAFRSNTGNFDADYKEVFEKAKEIAMATGATIMNSSSIDNWHFDKDGGGEDDPDDDE